MFGQEMKDYNLYARNSLTVPHPKIYESSTVRQVVVLAWEIRQS